MKLKAALIAVAVMLVVPAAWSQEHPKWEIALDYSRVHFEAIDYDSPNADFGQYWDLNGGGISAQYNFTHMFGIKAEVLGYRSDTRPVSVPAGNPYFPQGGTADVSGNLVTYMAGPVIGKRFGILRPYAQLLAGGAHSSVFANAFSGLNFTGAGIPTGRGWSTDVGVGLDIAVSKHIMIRPIEVSWLRTDFKNLLSANQESSRYVGGMVFTFGGKPPIPPTSTCSISPTSIMAGDPVTATMTTQNFNPKHTISYKWTSTGGTVAGTAETGAVTTTGLAPGSYAVTATATDEKMKKDNVASCSASFTVQEPPRHPPVATCSAATPGTIAIGETSTVTMTASSPDGRPLTYNWSATGGQVSGTGNSASVVATNADAGNSITVTGTVSDDRNLTASCTASLNVPAVVKCVSIEDWGECTFEKNPKKPWRVDNDCKDVLDKLSLRLQQMPGGKVDIVGYTNEEEVVKEQTLGAQRSVNVKYYLTTDGPTKSDASRIVPRQGGNKGQSTHFYFVADGAMCSGQVEEGTVVDESAVQGQSRSAPAPKKGHKSKAAAPPAQ